MYTYIITAKCPENPPQEFGLGFLCQIRCEEVGGYIYNIHASPCTKNRFLQPSPHKRPTNVVKLSGFAMCTGARVCYLLGSAQVHLSRCTFHVVNLGLISQRMYNFQPTNPTKKRIAHTRTRPRVTRAYTRTYTRIRLLVHSCKFLVNFL